MNRRKVGTTIGIAAAILGVVFILARIFVYEPFRVPSRSMEPTLRQGDLILAYKWPYARYGSFGSDVQIESLRSATPKRGDVVVFKYPPNPEVTYVKRIIGLPGDRVAFEGNEVSVNGVQAVHEEGMAYNYLQRDLQGVAGHIHRESIGDVRYEIFLEDVPRHETATGIVLVPPGQYFVMGDNRNNAHDSRYWGMVPEQNIFGKVVRIVMGENLDRIGPVGP